ncbi:hypothetical protein OsI_11210 [Oryza sativa Indica Group]|uniref:Uncharacterized protein n=1 Tax=Oryza sativa subsp. indica TaxID=39946 RepID=B8AMI4_ORYSI|nr:hypothetical protein OsI_11210 [Oryza sativa Indica Group]
MVREYQTARVVTGGSRPAGPSVPQHPEEAPAEEAPVQVLPEAQAEAQEEEPPQLFDGTVLEVDADGDMVIPPAAPAAGDAAPDAAGGDPNDSGDESDEEEPSDGDDPDMEVDDQESDNNVDEEEDPEEPRQRGPEYHLHASLALVCVEHFEEPGLEDYYKAQVHIRVPQPEASGWRIRSTHYSCVPFSTENAAINDAARRALYSYSYRFRDQLHYSDFRHIPSRPVGTKDTVVPASQTGDDRVDVLARVTAALNTDLEGATSEIEGLHGKLQDAQAKIAQLEAQLAGQAPPEEMVQHCTTSSPPRNKLRYGTPGATTSLG